MNQKRDPENGKKEKRIVTLKRHIPALIGYTLGLAVLSLLAWFERMLGKPHSWEDAKNLAETLALLATATFFGYKAYLGYFIVNLSVTITTNRQTILLPGREVLAVAVKLVKGDRGTLRLHDAK